MSGSVKLLDKQTGSILFECPIEDIEKAYSKAEEFEEMGLDIEMKAPSMPETLIRSLGASEENIEALKRGIDDEIESHIDQELGCSICLPGDKSKTH